MKKTIFFDMDGVIVDFVQGYKDAFDRDAYKDDPFTINQLCLQIPHFFRMLPVNEKGLELFELLKDNYNIVFLTTPMKEMDACKRDKVLWVQENLGNYDVLFSDSKADYVVDSESILIDDMDYNLSPWIDAGGTAIKFPAKIESITEQIEEAMYRLRIRDMLSIRTYPKPKPDEDTTDPATTDKPSDNDPGVSEH